MESSLISSKLKWQIVNIDHSSQCKISTHFHSMRLLEHFYHVFLCRWEIVLFFLNAAKGKEAKIIKEVQEVFWSTIGMFRKMSAQERLWKAKDLRTYGS